MDETTVRQEVFRLARSLGYAPITQTDASVCPHCGRKVRPPIGRPDILWLHPTQGSIVCEVKVVPKGRKSFPFSCIRPEQRRWLDWWVQENRGVAFLALGTLTPRQRRLWLVPWTAWKYVETEVSQHQESIPVIAGRGARRALQDQHLDLDTLLRDFECDWKGDHTWQMPAHSCSPI